MNAPSLHLETICSRRVTPSLARRSAILFLAALLSCPALPAQGPPQQEQQSTRPRQGQDQGRDKQQQGQQSETANPYPAPSSQLAEENLKRVAATKDQIEEVLLKDNGLFVELKRWVAKEASDRGQVVEDADLTDRAILDRLTRDVEFRSVATRLLQRYGYLVPQPNPGSEAAIDQALKYQAKQYQMQLQLQLNAQLELRKAAEQERKALTKERTSNATVRTTEAGLRGDTGNTPLPMDIGSPFLPPNPGLNLDPRTLPLTRTNTQGGAIADLTPIGAGASDILGGVGRTPRLDDGRMVMSAELIDRGTIPGSEPDSSSLSGNGLPMLPGKMSERVRKAAGERGGGESQPEEMVERPSLVRRPNPYASIPSLYDMYRQVSPTPTEPRRFGIDVFANGNEEDLTQLPTDLPVGPDYVVGPGDGLAIDLWGGYSQRLYRLVDREGRLTLPEVGPIQASGRTMGDLQQEVQRVLRTQFRDVSADISLSRLRTVRIYVVGDVENPGAYDISSLSTPLNALLAAGGPTDNGSLRVVQHYRGKDLVQEVDLYDLLLHGIRSDVKQLQSGDTVKVPPIGPQIKLEGTIRRPAIYELRNEKTLAEGLDLAGGILPTAALRHIDVERIETHQKRTMLSLDIDAAGNAEEVNRQLQSFQIRDGDSVRIFPIAPYNEDAVYLQGHVVRPGRYSYRDGMKLSDVINSYSDLLPEPAAKYAEIVRLNPPDFRPSVESFDLTAALANPDAAPKLHRLDTVRIFSRYDFENPPDVTVVGEVRQPGTFRTSGQAHVRDAVFLAGGVTPDASLESSQLIRSLPDGTLKIMSINLQQALDGDPLENVLLQSRDRLLIQPKAASVEPASVYVKGEVARPGRFPLTTNLRVEDLIRMAGGMKRSADTGEADLTRFDPTAPKHPSGEHQQINLAAALTGDPQQDLLLRDGDVLTIRQLAGWNDIGASVTVRGEVQHPSGYGIRPGERLSSILKRAGGFSPEAFPYGAVLLREDLRQLEEKSYLDLLRRVQGQQVSIAQLPESTPEQKLNKQAATQQWQSTLDQLKANPPVGRLVIHIATEVKRWEGTPSDIEVRNGDVLLIPKKPGYVVVRGQVYNQTALSFRPGKSAASYLAQSGGPTQLADKKGIFVIRADGSVAGGQSSSGWWAGNPLHVVLRPGDMVVVPEKAIGGPKNTWKYIMDTAQLTYSLAVAVSLL